MKKFYISCLFVLIILTCLILCYCRYQCHNNDIHTWATENHHTIKSIDLKFLEYGPFLWKVKGQIIYCVTVENDQKVWFRFDPYFGMYVEK